MSGLKTGEHSKQAMRAVYVDNLRHAAENLGKHGITALIEPVNSIISRPGYFMDNVDKGSYFLLHQLAAAEQSRPAAQLAHL